MKLILGPLRNIAVMLAGGLDGAAMGVGLLWILLAVGGTGSPFGCIHEGILICFFVGVPVGFVAGLIAAMFVIACREEDNTQKFEIAILVGAGLVLAYYFLMLH